MNSKKTLTRIKIFISLFASLLIVTFITPNMFIGETTAWNPGFLAQIKVIPYSIYAYIRYPVDANVRNNVIETSGMQTVNSKEKLEYSPVTNGVYAAQDPESGETIVKIDAGTELEVKTIKADDGKEIKVYVPIR